VSRLALRWRCCLCTVHTLPEGPAVWGVTVLRGDVYLLRDKEHDLVEVYDGINYRLQRCLTVPNCQGLVDMTSCELYLYIYVADHIVRCIHRLDSQGNAATQWPVNEEPHGLSVNTADNLLVTCWLVHKIKEFSSHGDLLREITLPGDVIHLYHAIQLTSGQSVVSHGGLDDPVHGVCMISADGRQIIHSHGGQKGSATGQGDVPSHLAVDSSECVIVCDSINRRVKLLSPTLDYVRDVVTNDLLKWLPGRLCLDEKSHRLYVADNEWKDDEYKGRVVVFSV